MAQYTVEYNIIALDKASETFIALHASARKIKAVQTRIGELNKSINTLKGLLASLKKNSDITFKITTRGAVSQLNNLATAAAEAKAALAGLPKGAVVGGAVAGKSAINGKGSGSQAGVAPAKQPKTSHSPSASTMTMYGGGGSQSTRQRGGTNRRGGGSNRGSFVSSVPPYSAKYGGPAPRRIQRITKAPTPQSTPYIGNTILSSTSLGSSDFGGLGLLKGMGIMYGLSAAGSLMSQAFSDYAAYDNTMTTTRAILGTHDKRPNFSGRFKSMENQIRKIGLDTKFTAPEVADASKFLAMAGMNVEDITRSMPTIADIALVADTDLGRTADLMTNIMTSYRVSPNKLTNLADIMTMGFTMSNTTLEEMAEAYTYFASIGSAHDLDFKDLTAMVGLLGDAGIKGSRAGTAIRQIMANMLKPTKDQRDKWKGMGINPVGADGKLRSMMDIFGELAERNATLDAFKLFRVTTAQSATSLIQDQATTQKWQRMREQMDHADGVTAQNASARKNNIQGKRAQVQSAFTQVTMQALEAMAPQIQEMLDVVKHWILSPDGTSTITHTFQSLMEMLKGFGEVTKQFLDFYNAHADIINLWIKWQLYIKAVLIPLRIVAGMLNLGLGFFNLARGIGQAMLGLRSFVTLAGSDRFLSAISSLTSMAQGFGGRGGGGAAGGTSPAVVAATGGMLTGTASSVQNKNWALRNPKVNLQQAALRDRYEQQFMPKRVDELNALRQVVATSDRKLSRRFLWGGKNLVREQRADALQRIRQIYNEPLQAARDVKLSRMREVGSWANWARDRRQEVAGYDQRLANLTARRDEIQRQMSMVRGYTPHALQKELSTINNSISNVTQARSTASQELQLFRNILNEQRNRVAAAVNNEKQMQAYMARADKARGLAGYGEPALNRHERIGQWWDNTKTKTANKWNNFKAWNARTGAGAQNWMANRGPMAMGAMSMAGAALGGYAGSQMGGTWGGLAGSIIGMAAPALIGAGPVGWAVGAALAIGGVTAALINMNAEAERARAEMASWGSELHVANGQLLGTSVDNATRFYNMIHNSNMEMSQMLALSDEILKGINSYESALVNDNIINAANEDAYKKAEHYQEVIDAMDNAWDTYGTYKNINPYLQQIFGKDAVFFNRIMSTYTDAFGKQYKPYMDADGDVAQVQAALAVAATEDSQYKQYLADIKSAYSQAVTEGNLAKAQMVVSSFKQQYDNIYNGVPANLMPDKFDYEAITDMSSDQIRNSFYYRDAQARIMGPMLKELEEEVAAFALFKNGGEGYDPNSFSALINAASAFRFGDIPVLKILERLGYQNNPEQALNNLLVTTGFDKSAGTFNSREDATRVITQFQQFQQFMDMLKGTEVFDANKPLLDFFEFYKQAAEQWLSGKTLSADMAFPMPKGPFIDAQEPGYLLKAQPTSLQLDWSAIIGGVSQGAKEGITAGMTAWTPSTNWLNYGSNYKPQIAAAAPTTNNNFNTPMTINVNGRLLASEKQEIIAAVGPVIDQKIKAAASNLSGGTTWRFGMT